MSNLAWIFVSTLLVNNFTLVMFLGLCSFFGVTAKIETAWRLGLANTFVLIITAVCVWVLNAYILTRAPYLRTIAFIVVIASVVQILEMAVKKYFPILFRQLGIYLPLITTNCAILGLALFQTSRRYTFVEGIVFALANPDPEIDPLIAQKYVAIVATGRSDYPNQINNVLAFPGLFRGLLDAGTKKITDEILVAAAQAIATCVRDEMINESFIVPSVFDPNVAKTVAAAVRKVAEEQR